MEVVAYAFVSTSWHLLVRTGRATSSSPSSPVPVAVYSAISSGERVAFKQVNRQTGHRLKQQLDTSKNLFL